MAVSWTTITNAQVAAGAPLTTALVTALRDNPEGIAQRASGALKAFNVPYNFQEFTANGTWTKPTDAETGDVVVVELCAGGGAPSAGTVPGSGGTGLVCMFDIDDVASTETIVVGAGGSGVGVAGGDSSFGTAGTDQFRLVSGGLATAAGTATINVGDSGASFDTDLVTGVNGGEGGDNTKAEKHTIFGGGGGGGGVSVGVTYYGGNSTYHGRGGRGINGGDGFDGEFPGGGGGAGASSIGDGGDGVVRVYCIKRS